MLAFGLRHPHAMPNALLPALRQIHRAGGMLMPQADPACAQWDPQLTYTLRPPGCAMHDREFTVRYDVNEEGLRDDGESLRAPAIIVLGDSYAMGWGVAQNRSFPEVVGRRLGLRVLNAGMSSYGTARELALLGRLDRTHLRAVVLQFCWNDVAENRRWVDAGRRLPTATRATWDALVAEQARTRGYWPGKHLATLLSQRLRRAVSPGDAHAARPAVEQAADAVTALLDDARATLGDVPIVFVALCGHARGIGAALAAGARTAPPGSPVSRLSVVDVLPHLRARHRFPLDGHLTSAGQRRVGRLVAGELQRRGVSAPAD